MAITPGNNSAAINPARPDNSAAKTDKAKTDGAAGANSGISAAAQAKQAQNVAILRANEQVSLRSNNDSLSLLYKTALEGINAELEPVLGENAAQKVYDSGIDTSPEATAERIVAFATAFYSRYKELAGAETEQQTLDDFLALITPGIEKGFADAKEILTNLKVYEGDVESGVDSTYDLVNKGLASFRERMLELAANPPADDIDNAEQSTAPKDSN
ncbi:MAG: DUF5610 domain-containing protein [Gammaproteobacteria bacterium]|nr:DUF5610 domain-containing protein [Gammaproteobacteria bacterium]MBU1554278.1 DUF5610 domain-containing protein [Gammaproteobacteria bacterium]MBU2069763.1 DUF5610 domain-containing protein [Gammaproteobacteria bacterium]MBU2184628.1 DUF5610 domain-containing protein [Gammaproteobacteria bacterium]MBU2205706.1 DUF5610 domain-containing protein [Gammaproteobacteria bacterium]